MTLTDLITERRLLAALIAEPDVLVAADDVETLDFSDPRHQLALRAIRQLRADGADVDPGEIHDVLRIWDLEENQAQRGHEMHFADKAGIWFIAELLIRHDTPPYLGARAILEHDMTWLRELADRRRALTAKVAA